MGLFALLAANDVLAAQSSDDSVRLADPNPGHDLNDRRQPACVLPQGGSGQIDYSLQAKSGSLSIRLNSSLRWTSEASRFTIVNEGGLALLGQFRFESRGLIEGMRVRPELYREQRRNRVSELDFTQAPPPGYGIEGADWAVDQQDRMSYLLALICQLQAVQSLEPGLQIRMPVAGRHRQREWVFELVESSPLDAAHGPIATWRLDRVQESGQDRVSLWIAPSMGYLPLRIQLIEADGDQLDQRWVGLLSGSTQP